MSKEKIEILKENLLKAHKNGCDDVKKVLENLHPDVFKSRIEYDKFKIYAYRNDGVIYKLHQNSYDSSFAWVPIYMSETHPNGSFGSGEEALICKAEIQAFDNQKGFFEWALKQIKS